VGNFVGVRRQDIPSSARPDLLRRFTPTPRAVNLRLMGRTVRLETNNPALLSFALEFFGRHQYGESQTSEFLWRIVCESDPRVQNTDVLFSAFADHGLRYTSLGQRGFLAVDIENREAVGFVSNLFIEELEQSRNSRSLDVLFCMTAPALGLTAMAAGCVGAEDRGVLVFGPPNSGKTTACYRAATNGFEFHADQGIFLDLSSGALRAWGDFFPAVFRPEALEFLPELRGRVRLSSHAGLAFCYFDKGPLQNPRAYSVSPACSLFLERTGGEQRLIEIAPRETISRLREHLLFQEDPMFDAQTTAVLKSLSAKPAYALQYGCDPIAASHVIESMLR
jgi:hypothetical protein